MNTNTFLGAFLDACVQALRPLKDAVQDPYKFNKLMRDLGWDVQSINGAYNNISTAIDNLISSYEDLSESSTDGEILGLIEAIGAIYQLIQGLSSAPPPLTAGDASVFISELPKALSDLLIIRYLNEYQPNLYHIFKQFGIIENIFQPAVSYRPAYIKSQLNYGNLADIISNPLDLLKSVVGWSTSGFVFDLIAENLLNLSASNDLTAIYYNTSPNNASLYNSKFGNEDSTQRGLKINLASLRVLNDFLPFGFRIIQSLGTDFSDWGLILQLDVPSGISINQQISEGLNLKISLASTIGQSLGLSIKPSGLDFKLLSNDSLPPTSSFEALLEYIPDDASIIFGKPEGTRLEVRKFAFSLGINWGGNIEFILETDLSGIVLVIDPSESDNFVRTIFGDTPKEISFPITIRWSSKDGITFKGSGTFEFNVKAHLKLGPIEFNDIKVSVRTSGSGQNNVKAEIGTNIKGDLGPIVFNVDNIGLGLNIGLYAGNVGPFNIGIGFKPPTGIGLAIDAPPVSGGGFLDYNESTFTYTGGLELNFSKISFSAIGILNTKMPGGEDGYSLLIIITAEFGPLPLGMGFTLNGLGGLLGLNRSMNPDVLRDGIKNNTLDNILFPHDIVKNANTIISNIGQAFPIKKDQFIIGPMAKIGWGTPTLLTIELGIMIELPDPVRLAILGVLRAILPTEEKDILRIQVNFLGIIDFDNKYISFDASLYDSKILTFGLFGDMALRIYWGDQPNFLLSVGGFHPKYTPPPLNLPQMTRLTIVLANENNLKISVETYFAITSNSVQFGAKVAAMAKAWKIQAVGALWFDILFQFSPFHFIADMGVMFAIKMGSKTILSIYVDLALEGPHPWVAQGTGSFKILFVKVKVSFNKTFGQADVETLQAAAIDPQFTDALQNKDNWQAVVPDRNNQLVAYKQINTSQLSDLVVDPAGKLRFSQNLLPLDTSMDKFGNSAISDYRAYSITGITGMGDYGINPVQDYFARNEFYNMSDDDKLSRPSYELFNSGIMAGSDDIVSSYAVHRKCEYEQITIDSGYRKPEPTRWSLSFDLFNVHMLGNYVSQSRVAVFDSITTENGPKQLVLNHGEDEFVLINRNDMSVVSANGFSSSVEAERALQGSLASQPAIAADWVVANRFELGS